MLKTLAILIESLVTFSESEGPLMEVTDLLVFDLHASMLLIPSQVFFHVSQVRVKQFKIVLLFTYVC